MIWLDRLHRWIGGIIGLVLALLGLSGAILVHRDAWIGVPRASDARVGDPEAIAQAVGKLRGEGSAPPQSILLATDSFGLHRLSYRSGAGAYADQSGVVVTRWATQWERPELWLFDFHHHLFAGDSGEWVIGIVGLCGLFFVVSGMILWWRTRKTFELRLWPRRMSRSAIVRQHRDLGVVMAPLLFLAILTGTTMIFRPVSNLFLGPGAAAEVTRSLKAPDFPHQPLAADLDWAKMARLAQARFPEAELRSIGVPRGGHGPITARLRQPEEWLPNGRTVVWFSPADGSVLGARDARGLSGRVRAYNMLYPLHAAKVGGWAYQLAMTLAGLSLTLLGTLAVWTFWFKRPRKPAAQPDFTAPAASHS